MTHVFSWHNSVNLCPATFCTPRLNLPVTPDLSWLPTFAIKYSMMKGHHFFFFLVLVLEGIVGLYLFFDVCDNEWIALDRNQDHSVIFVIEPKSCILGSYHLLLDHAQFTLIHGPNIPDSYAILLFTVSDFNFTTRHIHNWALLLLWPAALSFQELLVIAFWSSPVIYWIPSDYNKIFNSRL